MFLSIRLVERNTWMPESRLWRLLSRRSSGFSGWQLENVVQHTSSGCVLASRVVDARVLGDASSADDGREQSDDKTKLWRDKYFALQFNQTKYPHDNRVESRAKQSVSRDGAMAVMNRWGRTLNAEVTFRCAGSFWC